MVVALPRAPGLVPLNVPGDDAAPRGTWIAVSPEADDRYRSHIAWCLVRCPDCGRLLTLSRKVHQVADDGTVTPSLVCPFADKGCSWHVFARLEGWTP